MSQLTDPVTNRADKEGELKDAVSHYVLRLAYCRTDEVTVSAPSRMSPTRVFHQHLNLTLTSPYYWAGGGWQGLPVFSTLYPTLTLPNPLSHTVAPVIPGHKRLGGKILEGHADTSLAATGCQIFRAVAVPAAFLSASPQAGLALTRLSSVRVYAVAAVAADTGVHAVQVPLPEAAALGTVGVPGGEQFAVPTAARV
jgi:hypothetical protein